MSTRRREFRTSGSRATSVTSDTLCRFFERTGECRLGNSCPYKHSLPTSTAVPSATSDSIKNGAPASDNTNDRSPRVCRYYRRNGTCRDGSSCKFVHEIAQQTRAAAPVSAPTPVAGANNNVDSAAAKTGVRRCRYYLRNGTCRDGDSCAFVHERRDDRATHAPSKAAAAAPAPAPGTTQAVSQARACRYFRRNGVCKDGNSCAFSHDIAVVISKKARVNAAGPSSAVPVVSTTTITKTSEAAAPKVCKYFRRNGSCRDGNNCAFSHQLTAPTASAPSTTSAPAAAAAPVVTEKAVFTRPCRYFRRGECDKGSSCTFIHEKRENAAPIQSAVSASAAAAANTKPCRYFSRNGTCKLGSDCTFAHVEQPSRPSASQANAPSQRSEAPVQSQPRVNCRYFRRYGTCKAGLDCKFVHSAAAASIPVVPKVAAAQVAPPAPSPAPAAAVANESKDKESYSRPCRYFNRRGGCNLGDACPYPHVARQPTGQRSQQSVKTTTTEFSTTATAGSDDVPQQLQQQQRTMRACTYFARNGVCRDGNNCRFSHESGATRGQGQFTLRQSRVGDRPRSRSSLSFVLSRHAVPFSVGATADSNSKKVVSDTAVSRPFLENVLRNHSHKPGFVIEQHLSHIENDRVRILDDYRQPLGISAINLLPASTTANGRDKYISLDSSFVCTCESSTIGIRYVYAGTEYRGNLPVGHVSVPVDDLVATMNLLHDFLFGFILNSYA